ncbi:MAG: D-sedoheptulose 7-phosphate isomerase [Proteobacteria bacterium]|nr:D-sedoheptulose 7-phosphate isomerase [Pseudomonadota bacterium]
MDHNDLIKSSFTTAQEVLSTFCTDQENMVSVGRLAEEIVKRIKRGSKILSCGNGGSMCDAMHFAEELTGRFRNERVPLPAIAISDPSHITCTANDYGFEQIFSRYIKGVGLKGDLLLAISTSGNSPNIIKAVDAAKEKDIFTVGLLGKDGGELGNLVDLPIVIPAETSDRIQEIHIKIIHIAIEATEKLLGF